MTRFLYYTGIWLDSNLGLGFGQILAEGGSYGVRVSGLGWADPDKVGLVGLKTISGTL